MNTLSGVFGVKNDYQAQAPVNSFHDDSNYNDVINGVRQQATGNGGPAQGTIGRFNALNDQLAAAANGQGPNPALEQLKQTTSTNVNNAASQAASARGVNPALAMRTAVDATGAANQQAAGQAATMAAQQQIAARQQLGQNLGATGGLQLGQQGAGVSALGTAGGLQHATNQTNANVAGQNASMQLGAEQINAGVASQNAQTSAGLFGGLLNGLGSAAGQFGAGAGGGAGAAAAAMASGGEAGVDGAPDAVSDADADGGQVIGGALHSYLANLHGGPTAQQRVGNGVSGFGQSVAGGAQAGTAAFDRTMRAPIAGTQAPQFAHGGELRPPMYANGGSIFLAPGGDPAGKVPGKANVPGDSLKNDKVHAILSPGEIVIPRSIAQGENAPERAASFVASILKRSGRHAAYADGGPVQPADTQPPAPQPADQHARGWNVADKLHAALPNWLSARPAVKEHNARLDESLKDEPQQKARGGTVDAYAGGGRVDDDNVTSMPTEYVEVGHDPKEGRTWVHHVRGRGAKDRSVILNALAKNDRPGSPSGLDDAASMAVAEHFKHLRERGALDVKGVPAAPSGDTLRDMLFDPVYDGAAGQRSEKLLERLRPGGVVRLPIPASRQAGAKKKGGKMAHGGGVGDDEDGGVPADRDTKWRSAHPGETAPEDLLRFHRLGREMRERGLDPFGDPSDVAPVFQRHGVPYSDPREWTAEEQGFFEHGKRSEEPPRWATGWRLGPVPASGASYNHRDGFREPGVSMMHVDGVGNTSDGSFGVFAGSGKKKVHVGGFLIAPRGSDGEPLLIRAKELKRPPRQSAAAKGDTGKPKKKGDR